MTQFVKLNLLLESANEIISAAPPDLDGWTTQHAGARQSELEYIYRHKNGFLAFDRALRFFAADPHIHDLSLSRWNSPLLWRDHYGSLADDLLFFADDIFGGQFCIKDGGVFSFEPETGTLERLADGLEGWAALMLTETDYYTGRPLALDWQEQFGALEPTQRLIPTLLFTLGGEFSLANLSAKNAVLGMQIRGPIAQKIHGFPEGTKIRFVITD
jgi:hypothetical protein